MWLEEALADPGSSIDPLSPQIAIEGYDLPDAFHRDPGDRLIVATVRALEAMKTAGFPIEYGPADEPWGVRRFYVRDPFGKLVNILAHGGGA